MVGYHSTGSLCTNRNIRTRTIGNSRRDLPWDCELLQRHPVPGHLLCSPARVVLQQSRVRNTRVDQSVSQLRGKARHLLHEEHVALLRNPLTVHRPRRAQASTDQKRKGLNVPRRGGAAKTPDVPCKSHKEETAATYVRDSRATVTCAVNRVCVTCEWETKRVRE